MWRHALGRLPIVSSGRWAVGGSGALALHGLPVVPRDLDLIAESAAGSELIAGLGHALSTDESPWDRGDVRAARRALAIVEEVEVEILVEVEVYAQGTLVLGPPDFDDLECVVVDGRPIPVLSLAVMRDVSLAMGNSKRVKMVERYMHHR